MRGRVTYFRPMGFAKHAAQTPITYTRVPPSGEGICRRLLTRTTVVFPHLVQRPSRSFAIVSGIPIGGPA